MKWSRTIILLIMLFGTTVLAASCTSSSKSETAGTCRSESECLSKGTDLAHAQVLAPSQSVARFASGVYSNSKGLGWSLALQYVDIQDGLPFEIKVLPSDEGLCPPNVTVQETSSNGRSVCYATRGEGPDYIYQSGVAAYLVYADGRSRTSPSGSPQWALTVVDSLG
jgi:hypothetical protein